MKATDVDEPQPPKGEVALLTDRPTDLPTPQNTHTHPQQEKSLKYY